MDSVANSGPADGLILYSLDLGPLDLPLRLFKGTMECRPLVNHSVYTGHANEDTPTIYLVSVGFWVEQSEAQHYALLETMRRSRAAVILVGVRGEPVLADFDGLVTAWLEEPFSASALHVALANALQTVELRLLLKESRRNERESAHETEELHRAGMAISSEKDLQVLQHLILRTSRNVTHADAGTLYVVENDGSGERVLRFCVAQNDSLDIDFEQQVLAMDRHSLAGFVACTGESLILDDAYDLPAGVEYEFNPAFDQTVGYLTRSMAVTPMINYEGTVVGVIQLINRKRDAGTVLSDAATVDAEVQPFTQRDARLLTYLAGQAAVALENRMLLETNRLYKQLQEAYGQLEDYLREVSKVIDAASHVESGTFRAETLADVAERVDALGQLGRVFQRMALEVYAREERLKQQVTALHIEIDEAKRARQVAEITESDAFVSLQQKARALREKKEGMRPQRVPPPS